MGESVQALVAEVGAAIQRYQRSVQAFDDAVRRRLGLGPADLRCLDWLVDGPRTAGELSEATGLRPAATTAMVDRLVAQGYVERLPRGRDRRQVLVAMTEAGRVRTGAAYGPLVAEGRVLMGGFPARDLGLVLDLVEAMTEMTDRHRAALADADEAVEEPRPPDGG